MWRESRVEEKGETVMRREEKRREEKKGENKVRREKEKEGKWE